MKCETKNCGRDYPQELMFQGRCEKCFEHYNDYKNEVEK